MAFNFQVGQSFQDYDNLEKKVNEFEKQNFVKLPQYIVQRNPLKTQLGTVT